MSEKINHFRLNSTAFHCATNNENSTLNPIQINQCLIQTMNDVIIVLLSCLPIEQGCNCHNYRGLVLFLPSPASNPISQPSYIIPSACILLCRHVPSSPAASGKVQGLWYPFTTHEKKATVQKSTAEKQLLVTREDHLSDTTDDS